jgi:endonuclease G
MPKRRKNQGRSQGRSRQTTRQKSRFWALLIILLLGVACVRFWSPTGTDVQGNPNLLLGNPTSATANLSNANNYLIVRPQYVLSYNRDKGIANWASWQLNESWLGSLPRQSFEPDPSLPSDWYAVQPNDYTRSGFDRGHLVPAADRDRTSADAQAVFLMTNILPQAPDNNRGPWEKLESYCRDLARQGKELYIIAGGTGSGGVGERGKQTTIGHGNVAVPAATWKIIMVLDHPDSTLSDITPATRAIAVVIPNQQGIKDDDWRQFRTTIDKIETLTGYDFLTKLPKSTQDKLEAKQDTQ